MAGLFENFTYCILIIAFYPDTKETVIKYVTEVDNETKTFKYNSMEEISKQKLEICTFKKSQCIELMNCMYVNGYNVAMQPYNK